MPHWVDHSDSGYDYTATHRASFLGSGVKQLAVEFDPSL